MADNFPKGLNDTGGDNVYKFQGRRRRAEQADHHVARRIRARHEADALPSAVSNDLALRQNILARLLCLCNGNRVQGEAGSFFHEELVKWKELDVSASFSSFARATLPKVATMALLLHNKDEVIASLLALLAGDENLSWKAICSLIAVCARDLRDEMLPHLLHISEAIKSKLSVDNPEMTAELFRTLTFLFKYAGAAVVAADETAAFVNQWILLLGSKRKQYRELSAAALAVLLRKHDGKGLKRCFCAILRAASKCQHAETDMAIGLEAHTGTTWSMRSAELKDGAALTLFETLRGAAGSLHSSFDKLFPFLLEQCFPHRSTLEDVERLSVSATPQIDTIPLMEQASNIEVVLQCVRYLLVHASAEEVDLLWAGLEGALLHLIKRVESSAAGFPAFVSVSVGAAITGFVGMLRICTQPQRNGVAPKIITPEVLRIIELLLSKRISSKQFVWSAVKYQALQMLGDCVIFCAHPQVSKTKCGLSDLQALIGEAFQLEADTDAFSVPLDIELAVCGACGVLTPDVSLEQMFRAAEVPLAQRKPGVLMRFTRMPSRDPQQLVLQFALDILRQIDGLPNVSRKNVLGLVLPHVSQFIRSLVVADDMNVVWSLLAAIRDAHAGSSYALHLDLDATMAGEHSNITSVLTSAATRFLQQLTQRSDRVSTEEFAAAVSMMYALPLIKFGTEELVQALISLVCAFDSLPAHLLFPHMDAARSKPADFTSLHLRSTVLTTLIHLAEATANRKDKAGYRCHESLWKHLTDSGSFSSHMRTMCIASLACSCNNAVLSASPFDADSRVADAAVLSALRSIERYVSWVSANEATLLTVRWSATIVTALNGLLSHQEQGVRVLTLQILRAFDAPIEVVAHPELFEFPSVLQPHFPAAQRILLDGYWATESLGDVVPVLETCRRLEMLPNEISTERSRLLLLQRLLASVEHKQVQALHVPAVMHHMFGLLHVKFSPIWPAVIQVLAAFAQSYPKTLWAILGKQLYWASTRYDSEQFNSDLEYPEGHQFRNRSQARADYANAHMMHLKWVYNALSSGYAADAGKPGAELFGLSALLARAASTVRDGLCGCDARREDRFVEMGTSEEDLTSNLDSLRLGGTNHTDPDTHHRVLMQFLAATPTFAEARSRVIVPLFVAFMHAKYYRVHTEDPDMLELDLPKALTDFNRKAEVHAAKLNAASVEATSRYSNSDELLQSIVRASLAAPSGELPTNACLVSRICDYLQVFGQFRGWEGVFGQPVLIEIIVRLLSKLDGGIAAAAAKVLLAMRLPFVAPYEKLLSNLLLDDKFKDQLVTYTLVPAAPHGIHAEHRALFVPMLFRLLLGRLLQRKGRSAKDTPALRRTAILSFCSCGTIDEVQRFLYLLLRPVLFGYVSAGMVERPKFAADWVALLAVPPPDSAAASKALVDAVSTTFADAAVLDPSNIIPRFTTAARALGILHVGKDLLKHLGLTLLPCLHHYIAAVIALMRVTKHTAGEGDANSVNSEPPFSSLDSFSTRAHEIRQMCYARLSDIVVAFPEYPLEPWLPHIFECLNSSALLLPQSMTRAGKPSTFLTLLCTLSRSDLHRSILFAVKNAIPAVYACLSCGLPGSSDVFLQHLAAVQGEIAHAHVFTASTGPHSLVLTCIFEILENLFQINLAGDLAEQVGAVRFELIHEIDSRLAIHIPFLLQHLAVRMESRKLETAEAINAEALVGPFGRYAESISRVAPMEKGQAAFSRRQLALLTVVAAHIKPSAESTTVVDRLVHVLLPFVRVKQRGHRTDYDPRQLVLAALRRLGPFTSTASLSLPYLYQFLRPGPAAIEGPLRVDLLATVRSWCTSPDLTHLQKAADVLCQLYVLDNRRVGDLDYDSILSALESVRQPAFLAALLTTAAQEADAANFARYSALAPAFLHHFMFLLHDKDMAMRAAVEATLLRVISALTKKAADTGLSDIQDTWIPSVFNQQCPSHICALSLCLSVLLPDLHISLQTAASTVRRTVVSLLAELVGSAQAVASPSIRTALHVDLAPLINKADPEADLFFNLTHIQSHRRVRAFTRLIPVIESGVLTARSLETIIAPLVLHTLHDETAGLDARKETSHTGALQNEAVRVLGAVAGRLPFQSFATIFRRLCRQLVDVPELDKVLSRALEAMACACPVGMSLHAPLAGATVLQTSEGEFESVLILAVDTNGIAVKQGTSVILKTTGTGTDAQPAPVALDDGQESQDELECAATAGHDEAFRRKTLLYITTHILPSLANLMFRRTVHRSDAGDLNNRELRPAIAVAYVHMLTVLPPNVAKTTVPKVLAQICSGIRSREQDTRDAARTAFAKVAVLLGPPSLDTLLSALTSSLLEGYQVHVTGHILFSLLTALEAQMQPPSAESLAANEPLPRNTHVFVKCLPVILKMILDDVFGEAAAARDDGSGYKPKQRIQESKTCRAYESMEIVGRCIPFFPHPAIHEVTGAMAAKFGVQTATGASREGTKALFNKLLSGLLTNPSVGGSAILLYVHGMSLEFLQVSRKTNEAVGSTHTPAPLSLIPEEVYDKWVRQPAAIHEKIQTWSAGKLQLQQSTVLTQGAGLSAAMQVKGLGLSSRDESTIRILPEPKFTGLGKHQGTSKRVVNSGAFDVADVPLGSFALSLLQAAINKGRVHSSSEELLAMLDPFVKILMSLIGSHPDDAVVCISLRIVTQLASFGLPSLRREGDVLMKIVLGIVERTSGSSGARAGSGESQTSELAQQSMKTVTALMRACDFVKVSEEQQRALIHIIRADLSVSARQNAVFSLLKVILDRKFVVSEVYDCMDDVATHMVTSARPNVRALGCSCFLTFLIKFPMTDKRLQGFLDFFVRNLDYATEEGRSSMLDMLTAVITKFPQAIVDQYATYFLMPLVIRMSNDPSSACRAAAGAVLKLLFTRISLKELQAMVELIDSWLDISSGKLQLARAGCQVLILLLDARADAVGKPHRFAELVGRLILVGADEYHDSTQALDDGRTEADERQFAACTAAAASRALSVGAADDPFVGPEQEARSAEGQKSSTSSVSIDNMINKHWTQTYFALLAAENLLRCFPVLADVPWRQTKRSRGDTGATTVTSVVASAMEALLYPHTWVRLAAVRVIERALSRCAPATPPVVLCSVGHKLVSQLISPHLGEQQADLCARALLHISLALPVEEGAAEAEAEVDGTESDASSEANAGALTDHNRLSKLLARAIRVALLSSHQAQLAVVQWIAALAVKLPLPVFLALLPTAARLLFRITESDDSAAAKFFNERLLSVSHECIELLKHQCGDAAVIQCLNDERLRVARIRLQRRQDRAVLKVVDPEAAAQSKAKRQAAKLKQKKRKTDQYKMLRGKPSSGVKRPRSQLDNS